MTLTPEMLERLNELEQKYTAMGQNMQSYLEGLLYADYLTYWHYIQLDTFLNLQTPRTSIPDERIFIIYHQITELYFRLILDAMEQVAKAEPSVVLLKRQLDRINRYFEQLVTSFDIMIDGMDKQEFLQFRMSLLPASGFQSAQYRMIEIMSTDFINLVHHSKRAELADEAEMANLYQHLYWKSGATELATGKLTLTLKQFEEKYSRQFIETAIAHKQNNLWQCYVNLSEAEQQDEELITLLKQHDFNTNVRWRLSHFRSAMRYLDNKPQTIAATGGTNWQQYLPPKNQRVIFYPSLWSEDELENWGKSAKL